MTDDDMYCYNFPLDDVQISIHVYELQTCTSRSELVEVDIHPDFLDEWGDLVDEGLHVGEVAAPSVLPLAYDCGTDWADLLIGGAYGTVFSERFFNAMTARRASGWSSYRVSISGANAPQEYAGLVVQERDPTIKPIRQDLSCPGDLWDSLPFALYRRVTDRGRLALTPDHPPAFDFVVPGDTESFLVSAAVRSICEELGLRGMRFVPVGWVQCERLPGEETPANPPDDGSD